jgi:dihydropteroate synthase
MGVPGLPDPDRTLVMGVLNVTPDSFSDGGRYLDRAAAIRRGLELAAEGADIVDVGGESTRPGAERVPPDVEAERVLPVVRELAASGVAVSIDTMRARLAESAVDAGAALVNDVSGGLADSTMAKTVAELGTPYILMHGRGPSATMQQRALYADVVGEVVAELRARLDSVVDAGVAAEKVILDPGIGFAKTAEHNWQLLANIARLRAIGPPLLVGASRKSFLGALLRDGSGEPRPVDGRDEATTALTALLATEQVWGVRVHHVRGSADAVRVVAALRTTGVMRDG